MVVNRLSALLPLLVIVGLATSLQAGVVAEEKSLYRNVLVFEEKGLRCMKFGTHDNARQSCMEIADPVAMVFNPPRMLMAGLYLLPDPQRILVMGLGGGALVATLQTLLPDSEIDAVEIDPAVIRVAKKYFAFTPGKNTRVHAEDGRVFVKHQLRQKKKYDFIALDAFDHISVPEHMTTREYLQELKTLLTDHGVLAANTFSSGRLYDAESATYAAVFGPFYNMQIRNRVILAMKSGQLPEMETVRRNAARLEDGFRPFRIGQDWLLPLFATGNRWPEETRLLTDQYSPANLLMGR
ncbi:MAG: fused MFS/spermidine synthase [Magnetococcus sp. YQC-9]